jgi:hypothetical protein
MISLTHGTDKEKDFPLAIKVLILTVRRMLLRRKYS